jgi:hypothetical protein
MNLFLEDKEVVRKIEWQTPEFNTFPIADTQSGGGCFFESDLGQFQPS